MRPGVRTLGLVIASLALGAALSECRAQSSGQLVIYYGNETTEQAASSPNYSVLLSSLRRYGGDDGRGIAASIENDILASPAAITAEVKALLASCSTLSADIAVFTNALTQSKRFLFCRAGSQKIESAVFDGIEPSPDVILNLTPLSRPEYFQAALERAAGLFSAAPAEAILLTHSHGAPSMALMPRVSADVLTLDAAAWERLMRLGDRPPGWSALRGTDKVEYWRIIGEVSEKYRMRFALVVRQMCESGLYSLAEFAMIPQTVDYIAHTAMADLPYGKIDYEALASAGKSSSHLAAAFAKNLRTQGLHVETKWPFLLRLGPVLLWSVPSMVWFAPLTFWLGWMAYHLVIHRRRTNPLRCATVRS
ncbi:MAG: hypothetical protein ACJ8F3_04985 [Xanthobacteraceae bacterium]